MSDEVLREYVNKVRWQPAKDGSHQYTLAMWKADLITAFYAAVEYIREHGYSAEFYGKLYTYYDLDGYTYWTMGAPIVDTILINRKARFPHYV